MENFCDAIVDEILFQWNEEPSSMEFNLITSESFSDNRGIDIILKTTNKRANIKMSGNTKRVMAITITIKRFQENRVWNAYAMRKKIRFDLWIELTMIKIHNLVTESFRTISNHAALFPSLPSIPHPLMSPCGCEIFWFKRCSDTTRPQEDVYDRRYAS